MKVFHGKFQTVNNININSIKTKCLVHIKEGEQFDVVLSGDGGAVVYNNEVLIMELDDILKLIDSDDVACLNEVS